MKQCFGYVRVSTVKQGDGVSLEAQRDAIAQYAARHNLTISQWFAETITAAKGGRPLFETMVAKLKAGAGDGVVFHKIDRSARNIMDWARIGELHEAGVAIHFAHESFDFNSRGGRLAADIQAVVAADFIRNNRQESIKGQQGRLKQGLFPYSAPLGYQNTGQGQVKTVDPVKGPIVRELFELYATGDYSFRTLATTANEMGLTNANGNPVKKASIEDMIRNPFYMGIIKIQRSGLVYDGMHEPLVSPKLFEQTQAVRTGRRRKITTVHNYQFRGLFDCGHCGRRLVGERQKGRVYYRCHEKGCPTKTVREDSLEATIHAHLAQVTFNERQVNVLRQKFVDWFKNRTDTKVVQQAPFEIAKLEKRLSVLTDKLADEVIDNATYLTKKRQILKQKKDWEERLHESQRYQPDHLDQWLERTKNLCASYISFDRLQQRELLQWASSNRQVYGKKIVIEPPLWHRELKMWLGGSRCADDCAPTRIFEDINSHILK